jgi:hypothetical protein
VALHRRDRPAAAATRVAGAPLVALGLFVCFLPGHWVRHSTKFWRSGYDQFSATTYGNGSYTVTIKAT